MTTIIEANDASGGVGTEYEMVLGDEFHGVIDSSDDHDWVRLNLDANYGYVFRLTGDGTTSSIDSTEVVVRNSTGESVASGGNRNGGTFAAFTTSEDGVFYADLSGNSNERSTTGSYQFIVEREIASGVGTQSELAVGEVLESSIDYVRDHDWVRLNLDANYGYVFRLTGDGTTSSIDSTEVVVRNSTGESVASGGNRNGGTFAAFTTSEDGVFYADLSGNSNERSTTGSYQFIVEREIANGIGTRETLVAGEVQSSAMEYSGDYDFFRMNLTAGQSYVVDLVGDGTSSQLGSSELRFYNTLGEYIGGRSSRSAENTQELNVTNTGVYYVAVHANATGTYELSLTVSPVEGTPGADHLVGTEGFDQLLGLDGSDTLQGFGGNDTLIGGTSESDLRDVIYGGEGNDSLDGGYGNDQLRGDGGDDTIIGGFGVDEIFGGAGGDVLTGQAWSDLIFGGDGMDFINGGFGFDRVNGGAGADRFFHIGNEGHGSDWIQDYTAADGDVLQFGGTGTRDQFQVNFTETANAGFAGVEEAFVIYRPSGQILWALVDGQAQAEINLSLNGQVFDLLQG